MDLASALDELLAAPLEDFASERKRLAGELRTDGDREAAAQLLKVPKPPAAEWALAAVAREDPDALAAWVEVATELREASSRPAEVGGDAVRAAMAAHRTATATLVRTVRERGGLSEPMTDRVRALLQVATADPAAVEALVTGRTGGARGGGGASRAEPGDAGRSRSRSGGGDAETTARREADAAARREAEVRERRAQASRRLEEAKLVAEGRREEADRTATAAAVADEALEDARRTLHRRESEASAAHHAAAEAAEAAAEARRALEALRRGR